MTVNTPTEIVATHGYRDLPNDKLKEKVVRTFKSWLNSVYGIVMYKKQIAEIFDQQNTKIIFYKQGDKKLFMIDDSDERLAKFLGEQFALASKKNPEIGDRVIMNMIKRNDGDERLIVKA